MNAKYQGYSFPLRDTVRREKVTFHNRYGIRLAGDLYLPENASEKLAAVAVAGPFGAVKEQCAGLYAEELAARCGTITNELLSRLGRRLELQKVPRSSQSSGRSAETRG